MSLKDTIALRRSHYGISNKIDISDAELQNILETALKHVPSAFNSQSARFVLLLGDNHKKLWNIVKETLRKVVPAEAFKATESKIDNSFAAGYGTILFYEDQKVVKGLMEQFPSYANYFPQYSEHTAGMHQFAVWTMLREAGIGATLQHYQPLIDEEVAKTWNIDPEWKLIAQMPFGNPTGEAGEKQFSPIEDRLKVFK